ncbi:hypothetical protein [Thalassoglobus polymorphus]|uniref:Uncharacterized protein n=1 Tax=Thalassoglobus polymorphus TaxID=2527994 RepID=A0A517QR36_9PLAN|nr:hypothetical protein [Thalassoglobus polymorphus]QDT34096.1 hypothetical protein Mal48_33560 [Thalassoglobus polymorphus]
MQVRKRYLGGAAVIVGLAIYLSQFFAGMGTGTGNDQGDQPSESVATGDATTGDPATDNGEAPDLNNVSATGNLDSTMMSSTTEDAVPKKMITITIHEDRYRLTTDTDPMTGVDISQSEVVQQTQKATGGEQGVKLRVLRQKNAQVGAKLGLYEALNNAGVKREEIQEVSGFID